MPFQIAEEDGKPNSEGGPVHTQRVLAPSIIAESYIPLQLPPDSHELSGPIMPTSTIDSVR